MFRRLFSNLAFLAATCLPLWSTALAESPANHAPQTVGSADPQTVDVIRLTNGNKITGWVIGTADGMAEIAIENIGELQIPLSDIVSITRKPYVPASLERRAASLERRAAPRVSPQQQRPQTEAFEQQCRRNQADYERSLDRRFRQRVFDEERRRQLQLEADWREFLSRPNINQRFQEDNLFRRFGGGWGRFAPWGR